MKTAMVNKTMKIITNNHWRQFKYRNEVPESVLADQFDYQDEEDGYDGFFQYRDSWYHLDYFMCIENHPDAEFSKWDGHASGVVIRLADNGEEYQVGLYLS